MKYVRLDQLYHLQTKGHSSKGNQLKVKNGQYWYKADYMGYEGLSEYIVSHLLEYSNLKKFVRYDLIKIKCGERQYNGCQSIHFLKKRKILSRWNICIVNIQGTVFHRDFHRSLKYRRK